MVSSYSSIFCGLYRKERQREGEGLQGTGSKFRSCWLKGEGDGFETEIKRKVAIFIIADQSIHHTGFHPLQITSPVLISDYPLPTVAAREAAACCPEQPSSWPSPYNLSCTDIQLRY
jgi:hypothetical protein